MLWYVGQHLVVGNDDDSYSRVDESLEHIRPRMKHAERQVTGLPQSVIAHALGGDNGQPTSAHVLPIKGGKTETGDFSGRWWGDADE